MLFPLSDFLLQQTFYYNSALWNNKETFNLDGGKTGFDSQETKLPSYWNTPFSKICLGMKIGQQLNFIVINRNASSLYFLIADGQFRATTLGRATWKFLIGPDASLQAQCNKEGFNSQCSGLSKARIGIIKMNKTTAIPVTLEMGLVLEEILMIPTLAETRLLGLQTMVTSISRL